MKWVYSNFSQNQVYFLWNNQTVTIGEQHNNLYHISLHHLTRTHENKSHLQRIPPPQTFGIFAWGTSIINPISN